MRTGHKKSQQQKFAFENIKAAHRFSHGGVLRNKRAGRGARPLSTKESIHLVFKAHRSRLRQGSLRSSKKFALIHTIIRRYAKKFFVRVEQLSVQGDHLHALIRTTRRSQYQHFFRVTAGQIAQRFEKEGLLNGGGLQNATDTPAVALKSKQRSTQQKSSGTGLWKYRPFSRVVRSWTAHKIVRSYIQLNEKEARGEIKYRKKRLRGLSSNDWEILWS